MYDDPIWKNNVMAADVDNDITTAPNLGMFFVVAPFTLSLVALLARLFVNSH
jgi:hypothetical protein